MTPPATGATRSVDRQAASPRRATVRHARRISGPARPSARSPASRPARPTARPLGRPIAARPSARGSVASSRSTAVAAAVALPAPGITLPKRRTTRPGVPSRRRATSGFAQNPGIALRTIGALERVSASALLDRLIRGRVWIGLLAFALIGIVAMQLVVLKLNTGIGRTLQRQALLQRENAQLGIENSVYSAENRVAPLAAAAGMTFALPGTVHFVTASTDDALRAANVLSNATQTPAGDQSGSTEATPGETTASSDATPQSTTATGEEEGSAETSGSSSTGSTGGESAAQSSEPSSAASTNSSTSVSATSSSATASTPATTPASSAGEQTAGASAAPSSGTGASDSGASVSAGGTQAGSRE
jgi:hypothetical protein